jgi:hypothetical protein
MDSVKNFVDAAQADEGEWVIGYILCGVVELGGIIYVILVLIVLTIALPLIQVFNILIGIIYDVLVLTYAAGEGARGAAVGLLGNVARQAGRDARGAAGQINAVQAAGKKAAQAAASTKSVVAQARRRLGRGGKSSSSSAKGEEKKPLSKAEKQADKVFERESKSAVVPSSAGSTSTGASSLWFGGLFSATPPEYGGVSTSSDEDDGLSRV